MLSSFGLDTDTILNELDDQLEDYWDFKDILILKMKIQCKLESKKIKEFDIDEMCGKDFFVSELFKLEKLTERNYHDAEVMRAAECLVNLFLSKDDLPLDVLYDKNGTLVESSVFTTKYGDLEGFYIRKKYIKTSRGLIHETYVGLVMNEMRKYIPSFMYTYGAYDRSDNILFLENVKDSVDFHDYIKVATMEDILNIYTQVLLSLQMALEMFDFTHYDLHLGNVLVRDPPRGKDIIEYTINEKKIYLKVKKIAVIIDYGRSHVNINGESYGNWLDPDAGVMARSSFPMHDSYKLLMSISERIAYLYGGRSVTIDDKNGGYKSSRNVNIPNLKYFDPIFRYFYNENVSFFRTMIDQSKGEFNIYALPPLDGMIKFDHTHLLYIIFSVYEIDFKATGNIMRDVMDVHQFLNDKESLYEFTRNMDIVDVNENLSEEYVNYVQTYLDFRNDVDGFKDVDQCLLDFIEDMDKILDGDLRTIEGYSESENKSKILAFFN